MASVARHTAYNFATIALNAAASLLTTALIARWLAPAGMGVYSLVSWLLAMACLAVNMGGVTTTLKYVAEALGREDAGEAAGVLAHGLRAVLRNALVVVTLWLLAAPGLAAAYGPQALGPALPVTALVIAPTAVLALLVGACQGLQRYDVVARGTAIWAGALALGSTAALAGGLGVAGLMAVQALAATLATGFYARSLASWSPGWWRSRLPAERRATLHGYGGSLVVLIALDALVWQRSGVAFLGAWAPAAEVAYFALAFTLAQMAMRLIPGTLVGLLLPSMSRAFGAGDMAQVRAVYRAAGRWMAVLAVPVAVGGALLAGPLVQALYGAPYLPMAAPLAVMLAAGAGVMVLGFPASSVLYAVEGQRELVRVGLGTAAAYLALCAWLIPTGGALGAAIATALGQACSLGPGAYFAGRALGGTWPDLRHLPAVGAAAALMAAPVAWLATHLAPVAALATAVPVGAATYVGGLVLFRALPEADLARVMGVVNRLPWLGKRVSATT